MDSHRARSESPIEAVAKEEENEGAEEVFKERLGASLVCQLVASIQSLLITIAPMERAQQSVM